MEKNKSYKVLYIMILFSVDIRLILRIMILLAHIIYLAEKYA